MLCLSRDDCDDCEEDHSLLLSFTLVCVEIFRVFPMFEDDSGAGTGEIVVAVEEVNELYG